MATLLLGVPSLNGVAAAADAPACQSASSDSDGDGWGWENEASCKVVPSAPAAANNAASDDDHGSDGGDAGDSGCDYSQAHHNNGWGWNDSTRTSCPPRTVVSEPDSSELDVSEPDGFVMIDLQVGERSGNAHLTWTAPFPNAVYSVYSFVADSDGEVVTDRVTTQRTWATRTGTAANRFFMVIVEDGDNASAGSGLFNTGGECVDFCDRSVWRSPLDADSGIRRVAAVPAIVVVHIVREVARRAGQWCASNPRECSDALIYVGGQVFDAIDDDPAGQVAAEQEEDLIEQGFVVVDRNEDGTVVLERGDTTVEIETIDIDGPENGVVQTTWIDRDDEGRTRTVRIDREFVTEQPAGNAPVRGDVVSAETTYYYSITGELIGSATQYFRNGVVTGTSCSGQVGLTTCSESDDDEPMTTGQQAAADYAGGDVDGGEFGGTPTETTAVDAAADYGGDVDGGEFGGTPTTHGTSGADEQQNNGGSGGFDETESSQTTGEQAAEDYGGNVEGGEFG